MRTLAVNRTQPVTPRNMVRFVATLIMCLMIGPALSRAFPTASAAVDLDLRKVGTWPGYPRPYLVNDVTIVAEHLYLATAVGLRVVNVRDPSNPRLVNHSLDGQKINGIAASGSRIYLAIDEFGMRVLDISDPARPVALGHLEHAGHPRSIAVAGDDVCMMWNEGMIFIDATDLTAPRARGRYVFTDSAEVTAVSGDHAYVIDQTRLFAVDIRDPEHPRIAAQYDAGHEIDDAVVVNSRVWIANGRLGLQVLDIQDPANPTWVSEYHPPNEEVLKVAVQDGYAALIVRRVNQSSINDVSLELIDVSDPARPIRVGGYDLGTLPAPNLLTMAGTNVYAFNLSAELQVISVDNPAAPRAIGAYFAGGDIQGIAISGDHAYVADGPGGLRVLDIRDGSHPRNVGDYVANGYVSGVVAADNRAYLTVANYQRFGDHPMEVEIVDVSDPSSPTHVGSYRTNQEIEALVAAGNRVYLALGTGGLQILDTSDPAEPHLIGEFITKGRATALAVDGHLVYVVVNETVLQIVDVHDPTAPVLIGRYAETGQIRGVAVADGYAYLASGGDGVQVIDVGDPARPRRVGRIGGGIYNDIIQVAEDHIFAKRTGWFQEALDVIDVSDSMHPTLVGRFMTRGLIQGIVVSGRLVWLADASACWEEFCYQGEGVVAVDVSRRANPQRVGALKLTEALDVAVADGIAYVAAGEAGLSVLDVQDATDPFVVGAYATAAGVQCVAVSPPYAYVGNQCMEIVDVSDPAAPRRVASSHCVSEGFNDIALAANQAFLAAGGGGLHIIDITDPANPVYLSVWKNGEWARAVAVAGDHAYLAMKDAGLRIVDVSDPTAPIGRGALDTAEPYGIAISGGLACVADGGGGLQVIDVGDPDNPRRISELDISGLAYDVTLFGDLAFLALAEPGVWSFGLNGIQVVDLSDPFHPRRVGGNNLLNASAIAVGSNNIYVAAGVQGLVILNAFQPAPILESIAEPGGVRLLLRAAQGQPVRLQRSTDLIRWEEWLGITGTGNPQTLSDPESETQPARFYRAYTP